MITLSKLVKILKLYLKNPEQSNEKTMNDFLEPLVLAGKIKDREGKTFYLEKGRVSRILNQKEDVPSTLRNTLEIYDIENKMKENFSDYIDDHINKNLADKLKIYLIEICREESESSNVISLADALTTSLVLAIQNSNLNKSEEKILYKRGTSKVAVIHADIFNYGFGNRRKPKNIVVIPVNTWFSTHVTRKMENMDLQLVSENTLHGQWLIRWEQSNGDIENLNHRINKSLKNEKISANDGVSGQSEYPIGSIAIVEDDKAVYYLTAISSFDEYNRAHSTENVVRTAVYNILNLYDKNGQGNKLFIPLMGSGRSRAGLTMQESYECILEELLKNEELLQGEIFIVVNPEYSDDVQTGA